jgi:signal transduction histidine kinase
MLDRIAALVSDLRMVTDSLAHDIRSPLGRLCRHLETALDEGLSAEARAERIEAALGEAQQTLSIATGLLEISRIEAGLAVEQFEPVDLRGLARDVSELYSAAAEERGVSLRLDVGEGAQAGGVTVWGHPQLLAQALANLVDNAVKFAPEGTAVQVGVRMGEGGPVVAVADRGAGVPEDARMLVRRRFVQLDPSRGGQGTGLGLALVDAVVRLHGAVLSLSDNAPGLRAEIAFPPPTG